MVCRKGSQRKFRDLQENGNLTSTPFIPSTGWRAFPSNKIPSFYGHVHYYALESIPLNLDNTENIEDGLGHMTDKPVKNGRKYVDSGFVYDMMDITSSTILLVAVYENGATAKCYCCDFCEQWCCSLRLL